ncbi:MAG: hypothetical protein Q4D38_05850 [Planctomycetia bacterium]|nr:hypothetical protein [Planctomycetia bacterium]
MNRYRKQTTEGVHYDMSFPALDFFPTIVATILGSRGGFRALRVDNHVGWCGI